MRYRREIDGLRALAVLPVILFHTDIALLSGGFVGVDVFFVISGYLITSMILAEKSSGTFTLLGFYERRARRILPALSTVVLASLLVAWFTLLPGEMRLFTGSIVAVSVFVSNIFFLSHSGYFDQAAELHPLLHTWSLAVEEQYYVLFPLLLLLLWPLGRRPIGGIFLVAAAVSLAFAQWGVAANPTATFYLLPTRCWELLIGALIAFYLPPTLKAQADAGSPALVRQCAGIAGLLMILSAIFSFDQKTPVPGLCTLVPVVGAALIIIFATPETLVGRLLGARLLVGIGLISYSAYLWHWPLFAFARIQSQNEPGTWTFLTLAALSIAIAYLSWRYIETPMRDRQRVSTAAFVGVIAVSGVVLCSIALAGRVNGFEARFSPSEHKLLSFLRYDRRSLYREGECFLGPEQGHEEFAPHCDSDSEGGEVVLVWGDSNAAALAAGFRLKTSKVAQFTASGCPPALGISNPRRPQCKAINEFVTTEIARIAPGVVIMHANWRKQAQQKIAVDLRQTIDAVSDASPSSRIFIVGGVPQWVRPLPALMFRQGLPLDRMVNMHTSLLSELRELDEELRRATVGRAATFLSPIRHSCDKETCQAVYEHGGKFEPFVWDRDHLTRTASAILAEKLLAEIGDGKGD